MPDTPDSIHGIVLNGVTHEPLARALVYSPDNRFATMTNSEGRFEFTVSRAASDSENVSNTNTVGQISTSVPARPYMLTARKPGFLPDPNHPGQNLQNDNSRDLTLTLIPESLIVGTVTLPTSEAADDINLQIFRRQIQDGVAHWVPAGGTQSTTDGQFRFADLAAGSYKLLTREQLDRDPITNDPVNVDAQANNSRRPLFGYPPVYYQNASDFESATTIPLGPGRTETVSLTLAKQRYYRVKVPVVVTSGDGPSGPVNRVQISVYSHGRKGPGFSLGYNHEEHAIEGTLPNGSYTLEAISFGPNGLSGVQSIAIKGAPVEGPAITLVPNASIPVIVKEEFTGSDRSPTATWNINGRHLVLKGPRRYLNVTLLPADDVEVHSGATLRDPTRSGEDPLMIDGVAAGRYWVRVHSALYYPASVRSGNLDLLHQPLVVGVGGATSPIEITMRDDMAEISGKVEGVASSAPTPASVPANGDARGWTSYTAFGAQTGVHVYCIPVSDSTGQFMQLGVNSDGSFSYSGMAPGVYRVLAFDHDPQDLEYRDPEAMQAYDSKAPVIRLVGGQKERIQLQVISTGANQP